MSSLWDRFDLTLPLAALRAARGLTQQEVASHLHVNQASVSKLERRLDMQIGTLGRLIEAMGRAKTMNTKGRTSPHFCRT